MEQKDFMLIALTISLEYLCSSQTQEVYNYIFELALWILAQQVS
jgi:hypothetical protein